MHAYCYVPAAAARQQAHRVGGLRLAGVTEKRYLEGVYKVGGQDNNGFPYYTYENNFLYYHPADSSWYISNTVGDGAHKVDVKSEAGPVPTGSQTWDAAVSGSWVKRNYTVTELSEAEIVSEPEIGEQMAVQELQSMLQACGLKVDIKSEAGPVPRQLQAVQQQLQTARAAARQQAHRVSGLLLVARDSGSEAVYKVGGQDNNGFPYYKHKSAFLYYHSADSSWCISSTVGDAPGQAAFMKSEAGPMPTGSQTWTVAGAKRIMTVTELSEAKVEGTKAPSGGENLMPTVHASRVRADPFAEFCAANKFAAFEGALLEMGIAEPSELADVSDAELTSIGFNSYQLKRLRKLIPTRSDDASAVSIPSVTHHQASPAGVDQSVDVTAAISGSE
jgi:hypothetical protein